MPSQVALVLKRFSPAVVATKGTLSPQDRDVLPVCEVAGEGAVEFCVALYGAILGFDGLVG